MSDTAQVGARVQVTHHRIGCVGRRGTIDSIIPVPERLADTPGALPVGTLMYQVNIDPDQHDRPEWPEGGLVSLKRDEFEVLPPGLEDA